MSICSGATRAPVVAPAAARRPREPRCLRGGARCPVAGFLSSVPADPWPESAVVCLPTRGWWPAVVCLPTRVRWPAVVWVAGRPAGGGLPSSVSSVAPWPGWFAIICACRPVTGGLHRLSGPVSVCVQCSDPVSRSRVPCPDPADPWPVVCRRQCLPTRGW